MSQTLEPEPKAKRNRATKNEMEIRRQQIYDILEEIQPCTVRQAFYQCIVRNVVGVTKDESGYGKVQQLIAEMRRVDESDPLHVPNDWIVDLGRMVRAPETYTNVPQALRSLARYFRRSLWVGAPFYVEVWIEKDALIGTLEEITSKYDVPLVSARGFSSITLNLERADAILEDGRPIFVYHLGDWDPSGQWAPVGIQRDLMERMGEEKYYELVTFTQLSVTEEQIAEWNLPTRPTKGSKLTEADRRKGKQHGNTHAVAWEAMGRGDSVELDAISPIQLRKLVEDAIVQHHDMDLYPRLLDLQALERKALVELADTWEPVEDPWEWLDGPLLVQDGGHATADDYYKWMKSQPWWDEKYRKDDDDDYDDEGEDEEEDDEDSEEDDI